MTFVEFAVETLIREANEQGHKPKMLEAFRSESDEQLFRRVMFVMGGLEIAFMRSEGHCSFSNERDISAKAIVAALKEKLAPEIATMPA